MGELGWGPCITFPTIFLANTVASYAKTNCIFLFSHTKKRFLLFGSLGYNMHVCI
eukprot:NODE_1611_length_515_cov_89.504292_g1534_i0.p3 GENE.NODE_1611_length_515_cov_89.504292_g1534_i0~~NODE_1611_length_515_cov_89.504292_g1534_i0.p3  ORF type:complete len:64 (+),score=17.58 NODE_1611_length_515_cov_89.504292_g1534_i0:30-194(+)